MFTTGVIINLLEILTVAWVLGAFFSRFGLPVMLGELLAGVILGPMLLDLVHDSHALALLADLGIFFVMFHTGMEMDPKELLRHIKPSLSVALGGFTLPFALGMAVTWAFGGTLYQSLFMGMGISITAIAVQAVVLHSLHIHRTDVGHVIIGAAIADDILSLVALSILLGLAKTGTISVAAVSWVMFKVAAFFGATIIAGHFVVPRLTRGLKDEGGKGFAFAMVTALTMSYLAEIAGLHLIMGAFLAGQFVRKEIMDEKVYRKIGDRFFALSYGFLVPIFFATLSLHLNLQWSWPFALFGLAVVVAAIVGKLFGAGLGAAVFGFNRWECTMVGFGMNGRGAVELVVAAVVIKLSDELLASGAIDAPLLTETQFSALVLMAFVTTFLAPLALRWAVRRACSASDAASFCTLWDRHQATGGPMKLE